MSRAACAQVGVLDTDAVAALLDCELSSVQTRAAAGDLPGLKIGRAWVFPTEALLRRLNEMAVEEAAERRASRGVTPTAVALPIPARRGRRSLLPACLANLPEK